MVYRVEVAQRLGEQEESALGSTGQRGRGAVVVGLGNAHRAPSTQRQAQRGSCGAGSSASAFQRLAAWHDGCRSS